MKTAFHKGIGPAHVSSLAIVAPPYVPTEARRTIRSIYVVDDDANVRASLHSLLALRPDQVVQSFSSGDSFLADAASLAPGVLLLDFCMPGTGGMEVLHALRRFCRGKFAPLILTGAASDGLVVRALQAGALDLIEKPYGATMLLDAVDDAFSSLGSNRVAARHVSMARAGIGGLSDREREVLRGFVEGHGGKVIASALGISAQAVNLCRERLLTRLGAHNLTAALRMAIAAGMTPL